MLPQAHSPKALAYPRQSRDARGGALSHKNWRAERLRQRDRNTRPHGRFQRTVNRLAILPPFQGYCPLWRQK
jgi:hypothetical protein